MFYNVKYKKPGQMFFRTLKNVIGDGVCEQNAGLRFLILSDNSRVELPCSCHFIFSKERYELIKKNIEQQAGQTIPVNH